MLADIGMLPRVGAVLLRVAGAAARVRRARGGSLHGLLHDLPERRPRDVHIRLCSRRHGAHIADATAAHVACRLHAAGAAQAAGAAVNGRRSRPAEVRRDEFVDVGGAAVAFLPDGSAQKLLLDVRQPRHRPKLRLLLLPRLLLRTELRGDDARGVRGLRQVGHHGGDRGHLLGAHAGDA